MDFELMFEYKPSGSQPKAIKELIEGIKKKKTFQTLLGVTGSGKTFTMANVIKEFNLPTLVMAPNKTLAAQLYSEFKELFPNNAVEYFVSYYDYYQPEAYLPSSDTYIAKDADINAEIEKLKHMTTTSLLDRNDVIVIATVSAIYGLGSPKQYMENTSFLKVGDSLKRDDFICDLVDMHYSRRQKSIIEGEFRVRGCQMDIFPPYSEHIIRVNADEKVESISILDPLSLEIIEKPSYIRIFPAVHYILNEEKKSSALENIRQELNVRIKEFEKKDKPVEAHRIKQKTEYDLELIEELGYCKGIENYSRHLEDRVGGEPPNTLLDFFPKNFLCFIDESHIAVPQIRGMYLGDRSRKQTLVDFGFRLPSALDNRPLDYEEFLERTDKVVFVSATPGDYEKEVSQQIVEQIIRPTGLIDPIVEVRPAVNQVDDFLEQLKLRVDLGQKVLATTLTKRMSEDLCEYIGKKGFKVKYLHSEISTLERVDILNELRSGVIDVVVGVNLLREGLDLPEVSLVALMDADQEGFLRSETSLIQTIGRCSRNVDGKVILYADKITKSISKALAETDRRREIQIQYNKDHGIEPKSIQKEIRSRIVEKKPEKKVELGNEVSDLPRDEIKRLMKEAAKNLDFETAIALRNILNKMDNGN